MKLVLSSVFWILFSNAMLGWDLGNGHQRVWEDALKNQNF
jgi:hypothetical protein